MNAKLRKTVKIAAAGLFLAALAINVKVTLEDPFAMVNEKALAEETTGGQNCWDTITADPLQQTFYCGECDWVSGKPSTFASKGTCVPPSPN